VFATCNLELPGSKLNWIEVFIAFLSPPHVNVEDCASVWSLPVSSTFSYSSLFTIMKISEGNVLDSDLRLARRVRAVKGLKVNSADKGKAIPLTGREGP
jgi:hypothetical protein